MLSINDISRKKAFLIHLSASLFVFSILLLLIIYVWYPAPYFDLEYRMKWILLIAFVDVVIGPGLTLLVFKPGKPSLRFDMSVILIFQLTAMTWGVWNAWSAHPKLNVYFDGQLFCLDRKEIKQAGGGEQIASSPMADRVMAILPYPDTLEKKKDYISKSESAKPIVYSLGYYFEPATTAETEKLGEKQSDFMQIVNASEENKKQWQRFMSSYENVNQDWRYYRFSCFEDGLTAVLDRKNNKIEGVIKIELPVLWNK